MAKAKEYALFDCDVPAKDKYKVPNIDRIPRYGSRAEAKRAAKKKFPGRCVRIYSV